MKKCDIIIPIWNQLEATASCIDNIAKNTRYSHRLILVDNGSEDETRHYLEGLKAKGNAEIDIIRNESNLGFIKAVNQGLRTSGAHYVCVLNNDTEPAEGWLTELVEFADRHPDVGLLNPLCNGHEERNLTINEYAKEVSLSNKGKFMEMNQCQGFCMLVRRDVKDRIGYLDERFGTGGFDDTDYSRRAQVAGYKCVSVHSSYVYHKEHTSFEKMGDRKRIQSESEKEYFKKWPRHKRTAVVFSVDKDTADGELAHLLDSSLDLARRWHWVNLMIFGDKNSKKRIDAIKKKMDFPEHQNIKFNYLNRRLKFIEIAVRILERSFGRKARKRYDTIVCNEERMLPFLRALCQLTGSMLNSSPNGDNGDGSPQITKPTRREIRPHRCDIILPVCDQYEYTKSCIESIRRNTDTPYRLIVINNGKSPETRRLLDELERDSGVETTVVHNDRNIGWVKALNKGIELSDAPYVCFQNDDTIVTRGWLKKMIHILELRESHGVINPSWEGRPSGVSVDDYNARLEKNSGRFIETDWCRGFSVVIKRAVIERIGKVDEIYGLAYFDDVDYSVTAIEAGFRALRALDTYVYHIRNVTFFEVLKGKKWNELHEKNKLIYYRKWGRPLKIELILGEEECSDSGRLDEIERTGFYLARKQHHVDVWCPTMESLKRFRHTNIRLKTQNPLLMRPAVLLDLYMNKRKRLEKRYNAIFNYDRAFGKIASRARWLEGTPIYTNTEKGDFNDFVRRTADRLKEKTKEEVKI